MFASKDPRQNEQNEESGKNVLQLGLTQSDEILFSAAPDQQATSNGIKTTTEATLSPQ